MACRGTSVPFPNLLKGYDSNTTFVSSRGFLPNKHESINYWPREIKSLSDFHISMSSERVLCKPYFFGKSNVVKQKDHR